MCESSPVYSTELNNGYGEADEVKRLQSYFPAEVSQEFESRSAFDDSEVLVCCVIRFSQALLDRINFRFKDASFAIQRKDLVIKEFYSPHTPESRALIYVSGAHSRQ